MGLIFVLAKLCKVIEETQGLFEHEVSMENKTREIHCNLVYIIISLPLAMDYLVDLLLIIKEITVLGIEKIINFFI